MTYNELENWDKTELEYEKKDEIVLWKEYKESKNNNIRNYFVKKYTPLVKSIAGKISKSMPHNIEYEDLVSYGIFGLLDAIEKFRPEREIKFKTYATTRIRGSVYDELRSQDWIPRSIRKKAKAIEKVITNLENKTGKSPTDKEIAKELNLTLEEFNDWMNKIKGISLMSLNDIWFMGDENDEISYLENLKSSSNTNPDIIIEREEIKKVIFEAINSLPDKEKKVIVLYYYEDLTLKEIGEVLEVTESRISQLHTKATMRLRSSLTKIKAFSKT